MKRNVDSARYELNISFLGRIVFLPQRMVDAQLPCASGRLYITDAVMRRMSSAGCRSSGEIRRAMEYCALQFRAGLTVKRVDHESIFPESRSQRFSSGSRP